MKRVTCLLTTTLVVLFGVACSKAEENKGKFTHVKIDKPFAQYLLAEPLLMEITSAKIITLENDHTMLLAVASVVLKDNAAQTRVDAEKICRVKALREFVGTRDGVQIVAVEKIEDNIVVKIINGKETAVSVSKYLDLTEARVNGITKDMPVVGRWKSSDGEVFYLAIGAILDKQGKRVELPAK